MEIRRLNEDDRVEHPAYERWGLFVEGRLAARVREHRPYDLLVLQPEAFETPSGPVFIRDYF